ncbi:hypothetical protein PSTG_05613 [Puccinia striiformis f. sp. tritici PST-78]|uniref:Uncharacterized protein n=1 Tax=Puccinia striiformis f. sp. tritici PST-78 TaxID=1165861 RepID=A0A0L0VPQ6_9BASI|nr:hypothetical protein PSTG_05613 [Puccinia striiformis f. sp. tritici PST-78]
MSSRNNVTGRSSSRARPIRGAPRPMDGHAYTLEEINSLTAEQACWVEANPNFNDLPALHEDNMSEGELPFHEASQNDPLVSPLSGSSPENHNVGNPAPNPPLNTPSPIVAEKKPTHHMEVNSNETVRGEDSSQGFQYVASEANVVDAAAVREYFAPGNHSSNPLRAPSNAFWPPANHLAPHQSRSPEQPLPNSTPTPVHLSFTRPNVADYGPLPPQVYVTNVNKAMKKWSREIVPNFTGTDHGSAEEWLRKLSTELTIRYVHPGIWAQVGIRCLAGKARRDFDSSVCSGADPRTWDTFADWLMKHKPDTSNTEVVANAYRRLCQMPNERAVDFYNRFCLWQLDAKAYDYSHHEQTGFVKRLEPHLRQRVQTAISTAVNLGHPMNFEQIAMCAIDDDCRHQNYRGMNGVSCAPPQASTSAYQSGSSGVQRTHGSGNQAGKKKADYSVRNCYNCGEGGHISA